MKRRTYSSDNLLLDIAPRLIDKVESPEDRKKAVVAPLPSKKPIVPLPISNSPSVTTPIASSSRTHRISVACLGVALCVVLVCYGLLHEVSNLQSKDAFAVQQESKTGHSSKTVSLSELMLLQNPKGKPKDITDQEYSTWSRKPLPDQACSLARRRHKATCVHFPVQAVSPDRIRGAVPSAIADRSTTPPTTKNLSKLAMGTLRGRKFDAMGYTVAENQDRAAILPPTVLASTQTKSPSWWIGLFDGHGPMGHVISHGAMLSFSTLLQELPSTKGKHTTRVFKRWLGQQFQSINQNLPQVDGGSTGISILGVDKYVFISNLGDSQAFIFSWKPSQNATSAKVIYHTERHNAADPKEKKRVEDSGGAVWEDEFGLKRLVHPDPNVTDMALAMTRGFGDFGMPAFVSVPTTDSIDLSTWDPDLRYMAVAASDGLMDHVSMQEIATFLAQDSDNLQQAVEQLILKGSLRWSAEFPDEVESYRDDITLAVMKIQSSPK